MGYSNRKAYSTEPYTWHGIVRATLADVLLSVDDVLYGGVLVYGEDEVLAS